MPSIYQMTHEPQVEKTIEEMRLKLSKEFGVTVVGNRCTVRWHIDGQLVDVHMIIENVTTPDEAREHMLRCERFEALFKEHEKKVPSLRGDFYYAENGEHLQ